MTMARMACGIATGTVWSSRMATAYCTVRRRAEAAAGKRQSACSRYDAAETSAPAPRAVRDVGTPRWGQVEGHAPHPLRLRPPAGGGRAELEGALVAAALEQAVEDPALPERAR